MTPNEYQVFAMRTNDSKCKDRLNEFPYKVALKSSNKEKPIDCAELICGAMGLNGESGEVIDLVKKMIFHGHDFDTESICYELGDILWYVALICNSLGISMEDVMCMNINKLRRRYPKGFTEEASINRKV